MPPSCPSHVPVCGLVHPSVKSNKEGNNGLAKLPLAKQSKTKHDLTSSSINEAKTRFEDTVEQQRVGG